MSTAPASFNFEQARFNMIEQQIRPWEVLDPQVLDLLSVVRREDFAPLAHKALAFVDMEIPLGAAANQVMLAPRVQARLLQELALKKTDQVLDIGTGSGFMAALMAHQAASVLSLETDASLAAQAQANLQKAGMTNVTVRQADGSQGAAAEGPFDAILLSGSVAEVPQVLLDQLAVGGRLAAIVGDEPMMRATVITRTGQNSWTTTEPWDCNAPRLRGFAGPPRLTFRGRTQEQLNPSQVNDWAAQQSSRPVLLDVREAWELQTASAKPDSLDLVHMPMQTIPARLAELDRSRPIACLCHHGGRSMQVAHFLASHGYNVVNVAGGIHAWSAQVDPSIPVY